MFKETTVQGLITTLDNPSRNISANYTFTNGQRSTFYDYGFITRRSNAKAPKKQLKIYFKNGYYESTDEGDITVKILMIIGILVKKFQWLMVNM